MAGNMKKIEGTRMLLGKQPARMLLVDTSYPLLTFRELVNDLCQTLENVFSVATNIGGPSRMPFFSLMSLGSYPELHLPLSHVKNNYSRIQTSITDLYDGIQDKGQSQIEGRGCIVQGIQEACAHFHRQMKTMVPQTGGLCNQLEIILMTCQQGQKVQKQIDEAIMLMNLENVKRIQVVVFNVGIDHPMCEESDIVGSQNSLLSNISNNSSLSGGLVEVVNLDPDALSLQNFFNTWLLDSSTDSEHLHIILPALQTEAIAPIAPLNGSFEAVGDTDLIEETVVSLNKDDDKLDENNNDDQQGLPKTTKVQCDICSKIVQRRCLTRHMRTHGDQLIYSHCPAKFSDRWALTEHEGRHSNPLMCDVCGKKYTSRIGLSRHLRDHASTRPIECDICHQRFNDNAHFEGHRNSKHLNYKPFKCTVCSKVFAYRQSMARHVK
ncbi:unnamed protein product [Mytilus edulis]|uniref:C2H2-type domain-containing protein n=1 Tax=Mytilus edulis TaxID=6550 RepID=A0A8S3RK66_MYTED|nr:unnamed protein product [Mytilus edulis]